MSTRVQTASSNRTLHVGITVYINHVEVGVITFTALLVHSDLQVGGSLRVIYGNFHFSDEKSEIQRG